MFLFEVCSLGSYEIDMIVRYLDKDQDGFIYVADIQAEFNNT
jgi:hypothetical protein